MVIKNNKNLGDRIRLGVRLGVAKALQQHKRDNRPIVIWKDGKIIQLPPEEIDAA